MALDLIYNNTKKNMLNWLHTTSGFYDKKVKGDYFNFNFDKILEELRVFEVTKICFILLFFSSFSIRGTTLKISPTLAP